MTATQTMFHRDCPIGHKNSLISTTIVLPEGPLLVCKQCGHRVSLCSQERYALTMQAFDTSEGTLPNAKSMPRSFSLHAQRLKCIQKTLKLPPESIYILDVGCSSGAFLQSAKQLNFNIKGLEPAPAAAARARSDGFEVYECALDHPDIPRNYFNVLTLFEVIEHLENPRALLKQCKDLLKPGGLLVINTGNTDSWTQKVMGCRWDYYDMRKHGGHISFFNKHSMQLLAKDLGFKVLNIKTRCVKFFEKNETTTMKYKCAKVLTEFLNVPAQLCGKGHDMLVLLQA